jgi:hypothetical protein
VSQHDAMACTRSEGVQHVTSVLKRGFQRAQVGGACPEKLRPKGFP